MRLRSALLWMVFCFAAGCPAKTGDVGFTNPPPDGTMVFCPVSGAECEKTPLTPAAVFESKTYYFCCAECPKRFREAPERFAIRK